MRCADSSICTLHHVCVRTCAGVGLRLSPPPLFSARGYGARPPRPHLNTPLAMKTGFRAVSSHAALITYRAVTLSKKTPKKGLPGKNKISNFSNKLRIQNTSSSRAKQYTHHQLSRDMNHIPSCIVFLGRFWFSDGAQRCIIVISFGRDIGYSRIMYSAKLH